MGGLLQKIIDKIRGKSCKNSFYYLENVKNNVSARFKKQKKQKINLIFVCHRPAIWIYQKSIYECAMSDSRFNVTIVTIPNKSNIDGLGLSHEIYNDEGAWEYFKDFKCNVINGYDFHTKEFIDLKKLNPHYVFFQQPYNAIRPKKYSAERVFKYAKLCFIFYSYDFLNHNYGTIPYVFGMDFFKYNYFIFAANKYEKQQYVDGIKLSQQCFNYDNIIISGSTSLDNIDCYKNSSAFIWKNKNGFKILRSARWCTSENNCTFLEYEKKLFDFCDSEEYSLVFRPHPQAFKNYVFEKLMTEQEINEMVNRYNKSVNCHIDLSKDYKNTIYSSDVLVTDPSGLAFEYLLTEKPIIYTKKSNESLNDFALATFVEASYCVENWDELVEVILMLKIGKDPKKQKRLDIINKYFKKNQNAGKLIIDTIAKDFYGEN